MITVACVWVKANVPYTIEYLENLRRLVRRHLREEHEFVVLTDRPEQAGAFKTIPIEGPKVGVAGWWSKIELFKPGRLTGRIMYMDLDVLPVGELNPIARYDSDFALLPDGGTFRGRGHLRVVKKYNSSVMVWDDRAHAKTRKLYMSFDKDVIKRLWGDQDLIGEVLPYEETMPGEWFPRLSEWTGKVGDESRLAEVPLSTMLKLVPDARVVLSKKPKNEQAAEQWPWFEEAWR